MAGNDHNRRSPIPIGDIVRQVRTRRNETLGRMFCTGCRCSKPLAEFSIRSRDRKPRQPCILCRRSRDNAAYAANPERARAYYRANAEEMRRKAREHLKFRKYGITQADYLALLSGQGGRCAICGETEPGMAHMMVPLVVDHDHQSGHIRGLLCVRCNAGLGQFADDPDRLIAAAAYLLSRTDVLGSVRGGVPSRER